MTFRAPFACALLLAAASCAASPILTFQGNLATKTDIVSIPLLLDAATANVRLWTDSNAHRTNFDPVLMLWDSDGKLVRMSDDDPWVGPGQSNHDAGMVFASLAQGHYLLQLSSFPNYNRSIWLADGYWRDHTTPVAFNPACGVTITCVEGGSFWRVNLVNVALDPASPVPEPAAGALVLGGLGVMSLAVMGRRRRAPGATLER